MLRRITSLKPPSDVLTLIICSVVAYINVHEVTKSWPKCVPMVMSLLMGRHISLLFTLKLPFFLRSSTIAYCIVSLEDFIAIRDAKHYYCIKRLLQKQAQNVSRLVRPTLSKRGPKQPLPTTDVSFQTSLKYL